ncbi:MAG: DUF3488 and transglutaminase-like domain-containing protein [Mycobacteriales bacterium]
MTVVRDPPLGPRDAGAEPAEQAIRLGEAADLAAGRPPAADIAEVADQAVVGETPQVRPSAVAVAAFLSTAAAGWMLGGIFAGFSARLVGVLGALVGCGLVGLSYRLRATAVVQFLALPVGIGIGIALVAPATGGGVNPVNLVTQAIQAGGLSQPPVPFDPGWRFLLVVLTCAIGVTSATATVSFNRSRLAVLLPAPVMVAGVLLQPAAHELLSVTVALLLAVGALAVVYGADLARDSVTGAAFEARRLIKAGGILGVIVMLIIGLSQLGFLYPPQQSSAVIPPKRPQTPPSLGNQLLFTASSSAPEPFRTGELDVYDGTAWLTPPYDPGRLVSVGQQNLPVFASGRYSGPPPAQPTPPHTIRVRITINDLGEQRQVPDVAEPIAVQGAPGGLQYDPRSQTLQTAGRPGRGTSYTVIATLPPNAAQLAAAGVPGPALDPYLQVPSPPPAVSDLLATVPVGLNRFERLQFVRNYYFKHAVAAGPGNPVDVPPMRVQQILHGQPASPYEITAGEVLLARWAGIPARIGYGYYVGTPTKSGIYQIYPADGRLWLEAYFPGLGWVPILGHPAQATSSLDRRHKKKTPQILPNGEIVAQLYIPIQQQGLQFLYSLVQYWLVHGVLPIGAPPLLLWLLLPGLVKLLRRWRRDRWARKIGPRAQIATAYAEFRDRAIDFNVGHPALTPLEFLDVTTPDSEHTQLAWLVSRAIWGDLTRGLRAEDVETAERLARSLTRRLTTAQPALLRVAAFASRVSLREPFTNEVPNLWWSARISHRFAVARQVGRSAFSPRGWWRGLRRLRLRWRPGTTGAALLLLLVGLTLAGCGQQPNLATDAAATLPLPVVPSRVNGLTLQSEGFAAAAFAPYRAQALISNLALYAVRLRGVAVGTLQTAVFKPGLRSRNLAVRRGVIDSLGASPSLEVVGGQRLYVVTVNQVRLLVHFSADGQTYELLAADNQLPNPDQFFAATLTTQEGGSAVTASLSGAPPADLRRGLP